jgi:ATP-dependent Lhr-like helicase
MGLTAFHRAVADWFDASFDAPTPCQLEAWAAIRRGEHTLIAAPTGSGKTLAAFLSAIDDLVRQADAGGLADQTQVLYVSPLRALSNDIQRNLATPLEGIGEILKQRGRTDIVIRSAVRTGDTPEALRAAMRRRPPHILVTTPESLYILLTSPSGRDMLRSVRSVIIDEIHALAGNKRGAHLALSLERLQGLTAVPPVRIGLSATQRPIERVAEYLIGGDGTGEQRSSCTVIDLGHNRERDLGIVLPSVPLEAVMSNEVREEIYDLLRDLINAHRTTLVFVNTRRMAERVARSLSERIGEEFVTSHHGSLAREQRLCAEQRLKAGSLRCLVATASLELGIDIGDVDLVCQLGSTRVIGTFLQRVGRSGHGLDRVPKGRIFPLSRDDLIECIALIESALCGALDELLIPENCLDVLAQQIVAEVSAGEADEDQLFRQFRRAYPYRRLTREDFDAVIAMLVDGYATRRGRRSAYLFRDSVGRRLRPRPSARLTAVTCGGAIPDTAVYEVRQEPNDNYVGTVDEDFAVESLAGDIFQLGNTSWRILRVETGVVRVEDAKGLPPNIPFWMGEAPGRTPALSQAVCRIRAGIEERLGATGRDSPHAWLTEEIGIAPSAAVQAVDYLAAARAALGAMPTQTTLVMERFFDESGGMQLVLHAPFGNRLNRAWGLALRKRFCRKFNFELQAAATDDAVVLSLGETHSFALDEVWYYLKRESLRDVLTQAVLDSPLFDARWRWNATCSLAIPRFRGGRKVPPRLIRMQAEDLVSVVFPEQIACLENIQGPRSIPDHPLVNQALHDCLEEAMDAGGLESLLEAISNNQVRLVARDLTEPSPLAAEILSAKPYAFLDDAPLEERRTQAVVSRRWLDPRTAADLGRLDPDAIDRVRAEAWPEARSVDELHDALLTMGFIAAQEAAEHWHGLFAELLDAGRAVVLEIDSSAGVQRHWVAIERLPQARAAISGFKAVVPDLPIPSGVKADWGTAEAGRELLRGRLSGLGPVTATELTRQGGFASSEVQAALLALESEGFLLRGRFTEPEGAEEWCERRLLARIHRYTVNRLRQEIEPVSSSQYLRFLCDWHGIGPDSQRDPDRSKSLDAALQRLEGFVAGAAAWEAELFPARVTGYCSEDLDAVGLAGKHLWRRAALPRGEINLRTPWPQTPITVVARAHQSAWNPSEEAPRDFDLPDSAQQVRELIENRGALFFHEIAQSTALTVEQVVDALAVLVAAGLITADGFAGLRALLEAKGGLLIGRRRQRVLDSLERAGRWSLLVSSARESGGSPDALLDYLASALLRRYGVVFRSLLQRESGLPPWRSLLSVYRRMEARGDIRGGRFIAGAYGEQFALASAVERLRRIRKQTPTGKLVVVSGVDPVNLIGILTPGPRLAALGSHRILIRDGEPVAWRAGDEVKILQAPPPGQEWEWRRLLARPLKRKYPTRLRRVV